MNIILYSINLLSTKVFHKNVLQDFMLFLDLIEIDFETSNSFCTSEILFTHI